MEPEPCTEHASIRTCIWVVVIVGLLSVTLRDTVPKNDALFARGGLEMEPGLKRALCIAADDLDILDIGILGQYKSTCPLAIVSKPTVSTAVDRLTVNVADVSDCLWRSLSVILPPVPTAVDSLAVDKLDILHDAVTYVEVECPTVEGVINRRCDVVDLHMIAVEEIN